MTDGSITTRLNGVDYNTGRHITRCYDSNNCAAGWSCIDGRCAQSSSQAGSSCGEDDGDDSCGGGGSGDCTKSICGDEGQSGGENCCGPECCRRPSGGGLIECKCGECPPPPVSCIQFCDGYLKANGVIFPNCSEPDTCDECSTCFGSPVPACIPKVVNEFGGAPCYCDTEAEPPGECKKCGDSGLWQDDWDNCQTCYDVELGCFPCRAKGRCCFSGRPSAAKQNQCETQVRNSCNEGCKKDDETPDPCAGNCVGVTWCEGDQPEPPCPPGSSCTNNGFISAGGKTCYIRTDCDKSGVPESCKECDCNCEDDCPDCKICDPSGECVDDPACEGKYFCEIGWIASDYAIIAYKPYEKPCVKVRNDSLGAYQTAGFNQGILGRDPMGMVWKFRDYGAGSCNNTECGDTGGMPLRNGSPTIPGQQPSYIKPVIYLACRSYGWERFHRATGIFVGFGDSQQEAYENAYEQTRYYMNLPGVRR